MPSARPLAVLLAALVCVASCRTTQPQGPQRPQDPKGPQVSSGLASFVSDALAGRPTASGEPYDPEKPTCAHRTLPFGTKVEVLVLDTGASAVCRVNDRGPFVKGRVIDVSRELARRLGLIERGLARVRIRVVR